MEGFKMQISYHGHSVVKIKTGDTTILIDPFINGNKLTDLVVENEKPDVILLLTGIMIMSEILWKLLKQAMRLS